MKLYKILSALLMIFFIQVILVNAQTEIYKSVVQGQVVDEFGNPVQHATVYLETEDEDSLEGRKYAVGTDADGKFEVENFSEISTRVRHLFVSADKVNKGLFIVDTPN